MAGSEPRNRMIGLIGCGFWGANFARIASQSQKLKWCADLDSKQTQKMEERYKVKTTQDYKEILDDEEVEGVIIATPASTHHEVAKTALEAGKNVLVEKPMAITVSECEELIAIADKMKKVLMVGHTFEYNPNVIKLKEYVKREDFGKIYYIYSTRVNLGQIRGDVNAMWNLAPHDISIANYLIEEQPKSVRAEGRGYLKNELPDVVFLNLEYSDNVMVQIHVSWLDPEKVRKLVVIGEKKMAVFDDLSENKLEILDKGVGREEEDVRYSGKGTFKLRYGETEIPKLDESEPLKNEFDHFVDCISNNKKPRTDGQNGLRVVKVLEAAQKSLKENGARVVIE